MDAAHLLESLGHRVEEASPALDAGAAQEAFAVIWWSGTAATIELLARLFGRPPAPEIYEPLTWETYQRGKSIPAWRYLHAVAHMHALGRLMAGFHAKFDLWLTPCLGEPPPKLGDLQPSDSSEPLDVDGHLKRVFEFVPFTGLANMTGQPAMTMPLYWNEAGLPIGVHFFAPFGNEAMLFRLAGQLEQARPWMNRLPLVSAPGY
jgi:amidase